MRKQKEKTLWHRRRLKNNLENGEQKNFCTIAFSAVPVLHLARTIIFSLIRKKSLIIINYLEQRANL